MREHDLILHNGHVLTLDDASRTAEAIGVTAGAVSALGSSSEVLAGRGHSTRIIDLEGATVCPGFYDSHAHMDREGLKARGGFSPRRTPFGQGRRRGGAPRGRADPARRVGGVHAHGHAEARLRQPARPARGGALPPPATTSTRSPPTTRSTSACPGAGGCTSPSSASPTPGPWNSPASGRTRRRPTTSRSCARATASPPGCSSTAPTRPSSSTPCFAASRASPTRTGWRDAGSARRRTRRRAPPASTRGTASRPRSSTPTGASTKTATSGSARISR